MKAVAEEPVAEENIRSMDVTLAVFQAVTLPLKALASLNIAYMDVTLAVFQPERLPLKAVA